MVDRSYRVYVVQGQVERDWSDCQAALDGVPARVTTLPFVADPDVLIARARGAGSLHGETVGIAGLGNIGSAFARRVAALETTVIACDPYVDDRHFAALGVERVSLERLAERSDYVSVHTLLNTETRHLIGEKFFARMKPTALLINTSRGPVVDERALIRALQDRRLPGAAPDGR